MISVKESAKRAKAASLSLAALDSVKKNEVLLRMAQALIEGSKRICAANEIDMENARKGGMSEALLDRLLLTDARVADMAEGMRQITELPDPVGEVLERFVRPNGLEIEKVRVPMGLIGMIYEGRPNVTADAAALCFKAGSAVLLRGSASAYESCAEIVKIFHETLAAEGLDPNLVSLCDDKSRESVNEMLKMRGLIDLLVPRGGGALIKNVVENATVPVLETGTGNCHVYIDESADYAMAESIIINSKTQRTGVCNAAETLLVHEKWAEKNLAGLLDTLSAKGVLLHADEKSRAYRPDMLEATERDFTDEYLAMELAVAVVENVEAAVAHINRYGTTHTESIVTQDDRSADYFRLYVDAAVVMVNCSTRFTDGFEFGFGAELGISTQKLHARGPMGLKEMMSYKYVVRGTGQVRG